MGGSGGGPLQFFRDNPATVWAIASALMNNRGAWRPGDMSGMPAAIAADTSARKTRKQEAAIGDWVDAQVKAGVIKPDMAAFFKAVPSLAGDVATKTIEDQMFPKPTTPLKVGPGDYVLDPTTMQPVWTPPGDKPTHTPGAPLTTAEKAAYGFTPADSVFWDDKGIGPQKLSGGVTVNAPPSPAPGYRNVYDQNGNLVRQEVIPGGPVEAGQKADAEKAAAAAADKANAASVVTQDIDRALKIIEDHPNLTTSIGGAASQGIPGTPAYNVAALLTTVRANAGFDKLQAMRAASPTGGALGQVSNFENELLQSVIGNLDLGQSPDQLKFNLQRVRAIYDAIINGVKDPLTGKVRALREGDVGPSAGMQVDGYTITPVQ